MEPATIIVGLISGLFSPVESFAVSVYQYRTDRPAIAHLVDAYSECPEAKCRAMMRAHIEAASAKAPINVRGRLGPLWAAQNGYQRARAAEWVKESM
jgi:hypothetical protein